MAVGWLLMVVHATAVTASLWPVLLDRAVGVPLGPSRVACRVVVARSQIRAVLSAPVVMAMGWSLRVVHATAVTGLSWPVRVARRALVVKSHTHTRTFSSRLVVM